MTAHWETSAALASLLDALEPDLLFAPKEEVQAALRDTGRAKEGAVREIRSLLRDAERDQGGCPPLAPSLDEFDGFGSRRH